MTAGSRPSLTLTTHSITGVTGSKFGGMIANVGDLPYVVIIAVIVLVGGSQLPKIARNIGLAGKEFKKAQKEAEDEHDQQAQAAADARDAILAPKPLGPGGAAAPAAGAASSTDEGSITLSPAQLDALLKAREEQARKEASGN
jgi:TatA/E family protein of Tat protein translocase